VGRTGLFVVKMSVRVEIGAVAGRATLKIDRTHHIPLHKGFETVVNGRERDGRHLGFYPRVDFVCRRVISFLEQAVVDDLALRSISQTTIAEIAFKGLG